MAGDDLLQRAQRGDPGALDELCQREWRPIYGVAYRALGNVAEAQDLTQEVFLSALRSLDRFRDTGAPFGAYLATIARNRLRDGWRGRRPTPVTLDDAVTALPDRAVGPEASAIATDEGHQLQVALAGLPADYQTVIRMRVLDGLSSAQTGQVMGRSPDAVRQLQRRALSALRAALTEGSRS